LETARRELDTLEDRRWRLADMERDRAALLEAYTEKTHRGLEYFTPEDRHQSYKRLRVGVGTGVPRGEGSVASGFRDRPIART
jgi:hypothetical protein